MIEDLNGLGWTWMRSFLPWSLQNLVFMAFAIGLLRVARQWDARVLRGIALLAMVKACLPPMPSIGFTRYIEPLWIARVAHPPIAAVGVEPVAPEVSLSLSAILLFLWIVGVVSVLAWASIGTVRLYRRLGPLEAVEDDLVVRSTLAYQSGLRVLRSSADDGPLVIGFLKHRIIVPRTWASWSFECRCATLAHEWAHVRNHDHWVNVIRTLAVALAFFNPLAWLLARRLVRYSEMVCDDTAIAILETTPRIYARQLLSAAETTGREMQFSSAWSENALSQRIRYQLDREDHPRGSRRSQWWTLAGACAVAVLLCGGLAQTDFDPPQPIGGFELLEPSFQRTKRILRPAQQPPGDSDVLVEVQVDRAGRAVQARHLQGCMSSYESIRTALESTPWYPARQNGVAVPATLSLAFAPAGG